jgi:hypothetical protein
MRSGLPAIRRSSRGAAGVEGPQRSYRSRRAKLSKAKRTYRSISTETLSASTLAKPLTETTISFGSDGGQMSDGQVTADRSATARRFPNIHRNRSVEAWAAAARFHLRQTLRKPVARTSSSARLPRSMAASRTSEFRNHFRAQRSLEAATRAASISIPLPRRARRAYSRGLA